MEPTSEKIHFLDLRLPLGGLLTFYGMVLLIYGIVTFQPLEGEWIYNKSQGINVNLILGILMLVVGGVLLVFSFFKRKKFS